MQDLFLQTSDAWQLIHLGQVPNAAFDGRDRVIAEVKSITAIVDEF